MRVLRDGNAAFVVVLLLLIFGVDSVHAGGAGGGLAIGNFLSRNNVHHVAVCFSFLEVVVASQLALEPPGP